MRFFALLLLALSPAVSPAQTQDPAPFRASAPLNLELKNAQWFDGTAFKRGTLYVEDGKFTTVKPKRVNRRMDLKNQFMVPPLGEAHNYNLQNEWGVANYAQRYLQDGVFYAAMLCADPVEAASVRPLLATPETPDVIFATACITSSDGQPVATLLGGGKLKLADIADKAVLIMDKPSQVEQKWSLVAVRKTDWVRITLSYSERPELHSRADLRGKLGMEVETAAAVVRKAHQAGLKVTAHVDSAADFEAAVRMGVDQVAHLPGYFNHHGDAAERYAISLETAGQAARQGTTVVTATAASALFKTSPEQFESLRQVQSRNLQALKAAGVPLLLGSDVFTATAQAEVRHLAGLGIFSNEELLRMATVDTPRALFPQRKLACFDNGCEASFLLLASDPLKDIEALARPLLRVKEGRLLTQLEDVAESSSATSEATTAAAKPRPRPKGQGLGKGTATKKTAKPVSKPKPKAKPPAKKS